MIKNIGHREYSNFSHTIRPRFLLNLTAYRMAKGGPQNRGLFERKFKIVRIGRFWQFQRD